MPRMHHEPNFRKLISIPARAKNADGSYCKADRKLVTFDTDTNDCLPITYQHWKRAYSFPVSNTGVVLRIRTRVFRSFSTSPCLSTWPLHLPTAKRMAKGSVSCSCKGVLSKDNEAVCAKPSWRSPDFTTQRTELRNIITNEIQNETWWLFVQYEFGTSDELYDLHRQFRCCSVFCHQSLAQRSNLRPKT